MGAANTNTHWHTETAATIRNKIDMIAVSMNMRRNTSSLPLFKKLASIDLGARNGSCYATFALGERHPAALRFIGRSRKLLGLDGLQVGNGDFLMVFMLCFYTFGGWNGRNQQTESQSVVFQPDLLRCKPILITLKVYFVQTKKKVMSRYSTHVYVIHNARCVHRCVCVFDIGAVLLGT